MRMRPIAICAALLCWFANTTSCHAQQTATASADSKLKSFEAKTGRQIRQATSDEIQQAVQNQKFEPVLKERLLDRILNANTNLAKQHDNDIIKATYQATLTAGNQLNGELTFEFSNHEANVRRLGPTNLKDLKCLSSQQQLTLGKTADDTAVLLVPANIQTVTGYWNSEGQQQSGSAVFDLQLPVAIISEFQLTTPHDVLVTSPNSLVLSSDSPSQKNGESQQTWTLYPASSGRLTINCSNRSVSFLSPNKNISSQADYRIQPDGCQVRWNLNLPGIPLRSDVRFTFSEPFQPESILSGGQAVLDFSWDAKQKLLTIRNPTNSLLSTLVINGKFSLPESHRCLIPVLNAGTWQDSMSETEGELQLSSAALRVSFSSDMTVESSTLSGLVETDVEFTSDGSQGLALEQFAKPAKAEFQLLLPTPVLQDEVVTRTTAEPGQIEALIRIANQSGVAETIRYEVPLKYRVTTVTELGTQLPLLFRIMPGNSSAETQPIEIFFRSPLTRSSQQLLLLRLQSTASEVDLAEATLSNPEYLRLSDSVVFDSARIPVGLNEAEGTDYTEFRQRHPWIPAADDVTVFDRPQLPKTETSSSEEFVVTAAIDHAVAVERRTIRETIQIRLASAASLPPEIIFQTADSGDLALKPSDERLGYSLQRRINSRYPNEWMLDLPRRESNRTATFTLECERPATGQHIPMLVVLPAARVRTADIRIVEPTADWSLIDSDGRAITDAVSYPDLTLETNLRIQIRNARDQSKQAHGTATWLLDQPSDSIRAGVLIQLSTYGIANRISFDMGELAASRIHCLVNDHQTEVEITGNQVDVLLPKNGRDSRIQILIQNIQVNVNSRGSFRLPRIKLNDSSFQGIETIVIPPTGRSITAVSASPFIRIANTDTKSNLTESASPLNDIQHFHARRSIRQKHVESLLLRPAPDQETITLSLLQHNALLAVGLVTGCIVMILIALMVPSGPISWVVTGLGILLAQSLAIAFPHLAPVPSIMTAAFATAGAIVFFKQRLSPHDSTAPTASPSASKSVVTSIVGLLIGTSQLHAGIPQTFLAQTSQAPSTQSQLQDDILIPEQDSPIVFAPPEIASLVHSLPQKHAASPVFLDSQVTINLLTKNSISATVTSHIAVDSAFDQQVELPVSNVTLIRCQLDGNAILPIKSDSGSPSILIPAIPQPARKLDPNAKIVATTMKNWVSELLVYELSYTVRMVTRPDVAGARAELPVPPAPMTQITVEDKTEAVTEATLLAPKPTLGVRLGREFSYPAFSNLSRIEMRFQFAASAADEETQPQESEVTARIFASPTGLKINCDYEIRPVDARSESVRVPVLPNMNLIQAEAADGTALNSQVTDGVVEVQTTIDRQGLQRFQLAWQMPLTFVQEVAIDVQQLRQLNRIPADRFILVASTSDRFTIASIRTQQAALDPMPEEREPSKLILRQNEQAYLIPATVDTVTLQLVRLLETREASLTQSAVVERNQIKWSCECELQIPDEPIFRQNLTVSSDLKIQSVTARSEEIDRLQSWYRDGDQLVVCLREATRGSLAITINGILPRQPQQDTPLPKITLPESVEVLEYSLLLSATEAESVFIRSLEGTTPYSQFRTETVAVPTNPIRFYVNDETKPLIIRAEPTKAAQATAVALLSEQDGQTQIAIFMAFKAVESPFNLQFSKPSNVAYATSKVLLLPAEGSVLSSDSTLQAIDITADGSVADNDLSVIVITGIIPATTSSNLTIPLPVFDAPCEFDSFRVLDGRNQNGVTAVPRWIRNILPELPNATSPGNTNPLQMTVSQAGDQIKIQLPLLNSAQDKASEENRPAFAISTHSVNGNKDAVKGTFSTLAFSPTANATLEIALPAGAVLQQLRINGDAAPFKTNDTQDIIVTLANRTCLVEMEWLQSVPQNSMLRSSHVQLPTLGNIEGSVFIDRKLPEIGWRPRNVIADSVEVKDLLTEITSGLQIIGTGQAAATAPLPEQDPNQPNPLTDDPTWIELRSQSTDAAEAYAKLLEKLQDKEPQLLLTRLDSANPVIEIRQQFPVSSLMMILAAVGMIIAGLSTRTTAKTTARDANSATNISQKDAEGSTEIYRSKRP
ncbi:MAG: hypothetical protein ABJZ55_03655 [Fuerstiella sp.]